MLYVVGESLPKTGGRTHVHVPVVPPPATDMHASGINLLYYK